MGWGYTGGYTAARAGRIPSVRKPPPLKKPAVKKPALVPKAPTAPPAAQAPPVQAGQPYVEPPPQIILDSNYHTQLAKLQFDTQNQLNSSVQAEGQDRQSMAEAIRRLNVQKQQAQQNTTEGANAQGLYYSGILGKRQGDLNASYAQTQGDQQLAFDRRQQAREAARTALRQGMSLDEAALAAQSVDRQIASDQARANAGTLALNDPAQAPAAGPALNAGGHTAAAQARFDAWQTHKAQVAKALAARKKAKR